MKEPCVRVYKMVIWALEISEMKREWGVEDDVGLSKVIYSTVQKGYNRKPEQVMKTTRYKYQKNDLYEITITIWWTSLKKMAPL